MKRQPSIPEYPYIKILCDEHGHMAVRKEEYDGTCPHCGKVVVEW